MGQKSVLSGKPFACSAVDIDSYIPVLIRLCNKLGSMWGRDGREYWSDAYLGLRRAAELWKPMPGSEFRPFALQRMKWAILDRIRVDTGVRRKMPLVFVAWPTNHRGQLIDLPDTSASVLAKAVGKDMQQQINELVAKLPPREQTVIYLRYWKGLRHKAISLELGVTPSMVSRIHTAALQRLRGML